MTESANAIVFKDISKPCGEVLGIKRIMLNILPGINTLADPNGAGKTTPMNLMTGLLLSTGHILAMGLTPAEPDEFSV